MMTKTARIATWNVNSLKARREHVLTYLSEGKADILLLQELKLQDADFPHDAFKEIGFSEDIYNDPKMDYTKKLIGAIPKGIS